MKRFNRRIVLVICACVLFPCLFTITANAAAINAPEIESSNVISSGKIKLEWNAVSGAAKYKVYRSTGEAKNFKLIKTVSERKYTDITASAGKQYYYYVRAVTSKGKISAKSNIIKRYCDLMRPIITSNTNVASSGKIKLKWNAVDGAVNYKVYRSTSKNGSYVLMKTTTGTSYINTTAKAGKYYYYKVKATAAKSSADSAYSKVVSRTCDLARPDVKVVLNSKGMPKLTWNTVDGAVEYQVYRSNAEKGTYQRIKTTSGVSYTNTTVSLDSKYYYKVKAIAAKSSADSAFSLVDSIKTRTYEKRYVLLDKIYVYSEPDSKSKATALPYMTEFELGKTLYDYSSGKWYKLRYKNKIYYMWLAKGDKKFTDTESSYTYTSNNPFTQEVLDLAKEICFSWDTYYINGDSTGLPDADGRYGFDCSGYVTYCINTVMQKYNPAYRLIGNTDTLFKQKVIYNEGYEGQFSAKNVALDKIKPGDLIFLDMSGGGMNHVAIYLGNGELAHISGTWGRVTIMPLKGYFEERVVSVRRFIPEKVTTANETKYANVGWCRLYEQRSDESDVLYTFEKNEKLILLFTNSGGNWAYVKTADGSKTGFVLTKFLSSSKV